MQLLIKMKTALNLLTVSSGFSSFAKQFRISDADRPA